MKLFFWEYQYQKNVGRKIYKILFSPHCIRRAYAVWAEQNVGLCTSGAQDIVVYHPKRMRAQVDKFSDMSFGLISTARCSRRSSVLNLSDKPLLIPGWVGFWQIALSVPNGPSGSSMVPVDPQMAPDSPRESQTIIQVSEKFPSFTIFLSTIY